MKDKHLHYFKDVCLRTSQLSTCASKHVAALIVKDGRILSIGYNGSPEGVDNCVNIFNKEHMEEDWYRARHSEWSDIHEIHAEMNAILYAAKHGIPTDKCEMFASLSPCKHCAKMIYAAGITKVYYIEEYDRDKTGLEFLKENNIEVEKI